MTIFKNTEGEEDLNLWFFIAESNIDGQKFCVLGGFEEGETPIGDEACPADCLAWLADLDDLLLSEENECDDRELAEHLISIAEKLRGK